jgi:hypothetical protein
MNRYVIILTTLLSLLLLPISTAKGQLPTIEWQKFYASKGWPTSIIRTADGGYIVLANTHAAPEVHLSEYSNTDIELFKIKANGELEWQTYFGSYSDEFASGIIQTNDGGYAIVGSVMFMTDSIAMYGENYDAFICKVNSVGEVEWSKHLGGSQRDEAESIIQLPDNSYLVAANTASNDRDVSNYIGGSRDAWLIHLAPSGKIISEKCFGGSNMDGVKRIMKTQDGGYVFAGELGSKDAGIKTELEGLNTWIVKLSDKLDVEWQKVYGGSYFQHVADIKQTTDGGFIIASSAGVYDSDVPVKRDGDVTDLYGDQHDMWVLRLDSKGELLWQKILGGTGHDYSRSLIPNGNNYFLLGWTRSKDGNISDFKGGKYDAVLFEIDSKGTLVWERSIGGSQDDYLCCAASYKNGDFLLAGSTSSQDGDLSPSADSGIWIVKFRTSSESLSTKVNKPYFNIYTYPNPASSILKVGFSNTNTNGNREITIKITDVSGGKLIQVVDNAGRDDRNEVTFDVSKLVAGIYRVTVSSESHSESIKVVVVK